MIWLSHLRFAANYTSGSEFSCVLNLCFKVISTNSLVCLKSLFLQYPRSLTMIIHSLVTTIKVWPLLRRFKFMTSFLGCRWHKVQPILRPRPNSFVVHYFDARIASQRDPLIALSDLLVHTHKPNTCGCGDMHTTTYWPRIDPTFGPFSGQTK